MDLADEMHLYWPIGARVVGHRGEQDFTGTITEHRDNGLAIDTTDGPLVLSWGVVLFIAVAGYANTSKGGPGYPSAEVRMRVEGGDVVPLRQPPVKPPRPRTTPGHPYDPDRIIYGPPVNKAP